MMSEQLDGSFYIQERKKEKKKVDPESGPEIFSIGTFELEKMIVLFGNEKLLWFKKRVNTQSTLF